MRIKKKKKRLTPVAKLPGPKRSQMRPGHSVLPLWRGPGRGYFMDSCIRALKVLVMSLTYTYSNNIIQH